jgi:hypothetical protein
VAWTNPADGPGVIGIRVSPAELLGTGVPSTRLTPPTPAHAVEVYSDLPDFQKSSADKVISQLYGDQVHWNEGIDRDKG